MPDVTWNNSGDKHLFEDIVEWCDDAILSHDLVGTIMSWNRSAERLLGYSAQEIVGRTADILIPDEHREQSRDLLERLRRDVRVPPYQAVRRRKNGDLVDVLATASPIRNAKGALIGFSNVFRDARDFGPSRSQLTLLVSEMQHRVRNLAAVIEALGRSSVPRNEPSIARFFDNFMGRVRTLLAAGEIVLSSSSRQADLRDLADAALRPFIGAESTRIRVHGPSVVLGEQCAGGLALAFHELATNALKYGALGGTGGTVDVGWTLQEGVVTIVWKEHVTNVIAAPADKGFGSRLIRLAIADQRNSHTDLLFEPDGLKCVFRFEL